MIYSNTSPLFPPLVHTYHHQSDVEETLKRIQTHKGVIGVVVINKEGIAIRSTLDQTSTVQYATLISQLAAKAKSAVRVSATTLPPCTCRAISCTHTRLYYTIRDDKRPMSLATATANVTLIFIVGNGH